MIEQKKSTIDVIKTASKRAIQKTAEATGNLIGNKIADKITSVSKSSASRKMMTLIMKQKYKKKIHISRRRQQIIDKLRLV